ncbi:hypothetical protein SAMN05216431_108110 [Ligilactobacillus sp. WC1T17]|uniref:Phage protein n=1 Tax=Ligilactobacillus ruminis TaxID=1623 RepID=A0ABY1ACC8_9LACO|nr:hypothetical protein SAMN05216431_108110 [Ligilactobacillus ruminis]
MAYKTQLNANVPIQNGSGQVIVELPTVLHAGDYLMVGDTKTRWLVKNSTYIIHDEFHPKKEYVDLVLDIEKA